MKSIWNKIKSWYVPAPLAMAQAFDRLRQELPDQNICVQQEYWQNVHSDGPVSRIEYRVTLFDESQVKVQKGGKELATVVESALLEYRL